MASARRWVTAGLGALLLLLGGIGLQMQSGSILNPVESNPLLPTATAAVNGTAAPASIPSPDSSSTGTQPDHIAASAEAAPGEILLRFAPDSTPEERAVYVQQIGGVIVSQLTSLDTVVVAFPVPISPQQLPASPLIISSEPDYYVSALLDTSIPTSDPLYSQQWAHQWLDIPAQWQQLAADSVPVTVAVIDSGICYDHPDLSGHIREDGYDYIEADTVAQDSYGHGCAVAGIIAAQIDNGTAIAGIAPHAQILPLRVLDSSGIGRYSDVASAILYAADHGADIINLSLGGTSPSTTLEAAVNYAVQRGAILTAAAGNNSGTVPLYPAAYSAVIAAGSLNRDGQISLFSNQGADWWLPGQDIYSLSLTGGTQLWSGTSFASANAAGLLAVNPEYKPAEGPLIPGDTPAPPSADDALFIALQTAGAQSIRAEGLLRGRDVAINGQALGESAAAIAQTITLNLFDNLSYTAVLDRVEARSGAAGYIWYGRLLENPFADVVLVVSDSEIEGIINTPGRRIRIDHIGQGVHHILEFDPEIGLEGGGVHVVLPPDAPEDAVDPQAVTPQSATTVDLMVLYSPSARIEAGSAANIIQEIEAEIASANAGLSLSGINAQVRLVHVEEATIDDSASLNTDLDRITITNDGYMDNAHSLRNQYKADLVAYIRANAPGCPDGYTCCAGLAWEMSDLYTSFSNYAFSVTARSCFGWTYAFVHELGHNMGSAHDTANSSPDGGLYSYSRGYYDPGYFRTVMSYNCPTDNCPSINRWSNPNQTTGGRVLGTVNANNAASMNVGAPFVAAFRDGCSVTAATPAQLIQFLQAPDSNCAPFTITLSSNAEYLFTAAYAESNALPPITSSVLIIGNNATLRRSTDGGTPAFRFFEVAAGGTLELRNLTLHNGTVTTGTGGAIYTAGTLTLQTVAMQSNLALEGGAVYNNNGTVQITSGNFVDNEAILNGGAYAVLNGSNSISATIFEGNHAGDNGGAINFRRTVVGNPLNIANSYLIANDAAYGGAIYVQADPPQQAFLSTIYTQFTGNLAQYGGAIYSYQGWLDLNYTIFEFNEGGSAGGAIFLQGSMGRITLSTLNSQQALLGGAIYAGTDSSLILDGSEFTSNTASSGGAVWFDGMDIDVSLSSFSSNAATLSGGALYLAEGIHLTTQQSSFFLNTAPTFGGAIATGGNITVPGLSDTNCFVGNSSISVWHAGTNPLDMTGNWWGHSSGPGGSGPGLWGDSINALVDAGSFLTTAPSGCAEVLPLAYIRGTLYAEGTVTPIANAEVRATAADGSGWTVSTCSNAAGAYAISTPPINTPLLISANSSDALPCGVVQGLVNEYYQETMNPAQATLLMTTMAAQTLTGIDFYLAQGGTITVSVESDGGTPLSGVPVSFHADWGELYSTCTTSGGTAVYAGAPFDEAIAIRAGGTSAECSAAWVPEFYLNSPDYAGSVPVTVTQGQPSAVITMQLAQGTAISGTVTETGSGSSLSGIRVAVWNAAQHANDRLEAITNANGFYLLNGVPQNSSVHLYASDPTGSYGYEWWQEASASSGSDAIPITTVTTANINFTLSAAATISGTVYASDGTTPLPDVPVQIVGYPAPVCTNASGQYTLTGVAIGSSYHAAAGGVTDCARTDLVLQYWDAQTAIENADSILVTAGGVTGIDFVMASIIPTPDNLTVTGTTQTSISLSWSDNASDEDGYRLERSADGGANWSEIAQLAADSISHTDSGLSCETTYHYRVRAVQGGMYSDFSASVSAVTQPCPVNAPGGLLVTSVTQTSISLSWADNATNESAYLLERYDANLAQWVQIVQLPANSTIHTDSGLSCETAYSYRVRAYRSASGIYSDYAGPAAGDTADCPVAAPTDLSASPTSFSISLSWNDQADNETDYYVEMSYNGGSSWAEIAQLPADSSSYDSEFLVCQTAYSYRVRAGRSSSGVFSEYATLHTMSAACPPLQAAVLQTTDSNQSSISLSWIIDSTATSAVLMANGGQGWWNLATFTAATNAFVHQPLPCATGYQYRVQTERQQDQSITFSNIVSASTGACDPLPTPAAPAITGITRSTISLQTAAVTGAANIRLERGFAGNWQQIAVLPNGGSYTDSGLICATAYEYRIQAYRTQDSTFSAYSPVVPVMTNACPVTVSHTAGLYRNGMWIFRDSNSSGSADVAFQFGPSESGWLALVGDWDGDGIDGIGLYKNGRFILRNSTSSGPVDLVFTFGPAQPGWIPVAGDWNGDDLDTVGIYRDGTFLLTDSIPAATIDYRVGLGPVEAGWQPFSGDWTGGGADTVGIYRNGEWLLTHSLVNPRVDLRFVYGPAQAGWQPLASDWGASGADGIGIYSLNIWRLRNTPGAGSPDIGFNFGNGQAGWQALAAFRGGMAAVQPFTAYSNTLSLFTMPDPTATPEATIPPPTATATALPEQTAEPVIPESTAETGG